MYQTFCSHKKENRMFCTQDMKLFVSPKLVANSKTLEVSLKQIILASMPELYQNKIKFSKKVTSKWDRTFDPRTVVITSCVQPHALPTGLSGQVLIEGPLTQLLFVHQLTFGLRGTERIQLKSIQHDYIRIIKVLDFQAMGISTVGKA